jgi:phospholipid/cholesterol/gamma-HCH transport system substrate-binding protein
VQYNNLPEDTTASIFTAGLLGEQYVSLEPGGSDDYLKNGGNIEITQSAIILEKAIGQFLFKSAEEKAEGKKK